MHQFSTFLLLYGILISFHLLISKISKNHDEIVHWVILATISLDKQRTEFLFCIHICMSITSFVTPSQPNIFKYNIHFSLLLRHITAIITNYFWYPVITLRNKNNRCVQLFCADILTFETSINLWIDGIMIFIFAKICRFEECYLTLSS